MNRILVEGVGASGSPSPTSRSTCGFKVEAETSRIIETALVSDPELSQLVYIQGLQITNLDSVDLNGFRAQVIQDYKEFWKRSTNPKGTSLRQSSCLKLNALLEDGGVHVDVIAEVNGLVVLPDHNKKILYGKCSDLAPITFVRRRVPS